ncbi:hypothetical protein [Streptomyces celluloflavus]|uniref:hypothetical protein n=1 Tax=Streptomyces celluloflavus TaxID=58344 RepID=UPI003460C8C4|nr:hypothetical protein OG717_30330 [Streptomyces celluloflavus]
MDAEPYERWHPDRVRITPDRLVLLGAKRREILNQHLAHLEAHGRTPRVCLYTLNPVGEQPARSFAAARAHTDGKGWRVGAYRCMAEARSILTSDDEPTPLQKAVSAVRSVLRAPQRT